MPFPMRRRCGRRSGRQGAHAFLNKFVDEHVMNYVSMHGCTASSAWLGSRDRTGALRAHGREDSTARTTREVAHGARRVSTSPDLANAKRKVSVALDKVEEQLSRTAWLG